MLPAKAHKSRTFEDRVETSESQQRKKRPRVDETSNVINGFFTEKQRDRSPDLENDDELMTENYRPPVIQLNALQRLNLLKKRRDKWRISTLYNIKNFHSRGAHKSYSNNTNNNILTNSASAGGNSLVKYVETATQTDDAPQLHSKPAISKTTAKDEAERKLKQGVFSGLLFYDPKEIKDDEERSPVKFSSKQRKNEFLGGVSKNQLGSLLNDGDKLVQREAPKQEASKARKVQSEEVVVDDQKAEAPKSKPAIPSAGFNFLKAKIEEINESDEDEDEGRSRKKKAKSGLELDNIGGHTSTLSSSSSNAINKKDSLFGATAPSNSLFGVKEKEPTAEPSFSFGEKKVEAPTSEPPIFGSSVETKEKSSIPKPSFEFGSSSNIDKKETSANPTGFSFGSSNKENKDDSSSLPAKPSFSFGPSSGTEEKNEASKPSFGFGSLPKPAEKKDDAPKTVGFSFGSSTTTTEKEKASKPTFAFGTTAEKKEDNAATPSFTFGSNTTENKDTQSKPSFAFSSASATTKEKDSTAAKVFNFGSTSTEQKNQPVKPSFSFGGVSTSSVPPAQIKDNDTSKPLSFGSSDSLNNKKDEPKPTSQFNFNTTSKPSEPAKIFGGLSNNNLFNSKPAEDKPATSLFNANATVAPSEPKPFAFGGTSTTDKPSFNFGGSSSAAEAPKLSFNFGETKLPTSSTPSASASPGPIAFNGSTTTATKPTFNFGSSTTSQNPASIFGGSAQSQNAAPSANSAFGFTSTPASASSSTPSAFGQPIQSTTAGFNFGAAPSNTSQQPIFGGVNSNAASAAPPVSSAFGGPATAGTPTSFNFTGMNNANPAQIFGQTPPVFGAVNNAEGSAPATPTAVANRVPGRRIAQMRQRRR